MGDYVKYVNFSVWNFLNKFLFSSCFLLGIKLEIGYVLEFYMYVFFIFVNF